MATALAGGGGERPAVEVANAVASLRVDLAGGSIAAFRLKGDHSTNPLSWDAAVHDGTDPSSLEGRPLGHFLCLDRWGPPSAAEEAAGMPYHGEASSTTWCAQDAALGRGRRFTADLKLAGLQAAREVCFVDDDQPLAVVTESVTNMNALGRVYNMVQHPSIAAPFLDVDTVADCNGRRGFLQGPNRTDCAAPAEPAFEFPGALNRAGEAVNARHMTGGGDDVMSFEVSPDSDFGWVCATNAKLGTVIGYVWPKSHYPWISLWCCSRDGKPCARGLEFGTTGLHQPFPILARHPTLFDLPTSSYIDAGETCTRQYAMFLLTVPTDFEGVRALDLEGGALTVAEHGAGRKLTIPVNVAAALGLEPAPTP